MHQIGCYTALVTFIGWLWAALSWPWKMLRHFSLKGSAFIIYEFMSMCREQKDMYLMLHETSQLKPSYNFGAVEWLSDYQRPWVQYPLLFNEDMRSSAWCTRKIRNSEGGFFCLWGIRCRCILNPVVPRSTLNRHWELPEAYVENSCAGSKQSCSQWVLRFWDGCLRQTILFWWWPSFRG